jgi:opacity protein-like surface antigen
MKRILVMALVATALLAGAAHAASIGLGFFGGASVPIVQEDQDNGSVWGLRAPVKLLPLLTAEPYFSSAALGDKTQSVGGFSVTREGSDVTSFGLNAMLTMGGPVRFYPFAGIGTAKYKRTGQDESFTAYNLGLGLGIGVIPKLDLDLRGEFQAAADGDVSRKVVNISLGASYAIFSIP